MKQRAYRFLVDDAVASQFNEFLKNRNLTITSYFMGKIAEDLKIEIPVGRKRCKVFVHNELTRENGIFNSIYAASKATGINRRTIDNYLDSGKAFKNWIFERM